jgi:hypothetical protein
MIDPDRLGAVYGFDEMTFVVVKLRPWDESVDALILDDRSAYPLKSGSTIRVHSYTDFWKDSAQL